MVENFSAAASLDDAWRLLGVQDKEVVCEEGQNAEYRP
jgi:hypothetical protein